MSHESVDQRDVPWMDAFYTSTTYEEKRQLMRATYHILILGFVTIPSDVDNAVLMIDFAVRAEILELARTFDEYRRAVKTVYAQEFKSLETTGASKGDALDITDDAVTDVTKLFYEQTDPFHIMMSGNFIEAQYPRIAGILANVPEEKLSVYFNITIPPGIAASPPQRISMAALLGYKKLLLSLLPNKALSPVEFELQRYELQKLWNSFIIFHYPSIICPIMKECYAPTVGDDTTITIGGDTMKLHTAHDVAVKFMFDNRFMNRTQCPHVRCLNNLGEYFILMHRTSLRTILNKMFMEI